MLGGWCIDLAGLWDAVPQADKDLDYRPGQPAERPPVEPASEADVDAALARLNTERLPQESYAAHWLRRGGANDSSLRR
jgi:hypothetical protein